MEKFIKSSDAVELLEITLYKNICVQWYIQNICHKANDKTEAPFSISRNLEVNKYPSKENLFGQSVLLMNATYVVFP